MKKTTAFSTQVIPVIATIIVLTLVASIAEAGAVSCDPEQSAGNSYYPNPYLSSDGSCPDFPATVYAYRDCIDQYGNACRITWDENYNVQYYLAYQDQFFYYCNVIGGTWVSNTNIVDPCQ